MSFIEFYDCTFLLYTASYEAENPVVFELIAQ